MSKTRRTVWGDRANSGLLRILISPKTTTFRDRVDHETLFENLISSHHKWGFGADKNQFKAYVHYLEENTPFKDIKTKEKCFIPKRIIDYLIEESKLGKTKKIKTTSSPSDKYILVKNNNSAGILHTRTYRHQTFEKETFLGVKRDRLIADYDETLLSYAMYRKGRILAESIWCTGLHEGARTQQHNLKIPEVYIIEDVLREVPKDSYCKPLIEHLLYQKIHKEDSPQ